MTDATALGGVGDERAAGAAELVVEGHAGGECEQSGGDAGAQVAQGAGAVALEREDVLAGFDDRLDALPDAGDDRGLAGLVFAVGPDDLGAELVGGGGELGAGVALVGDDRLAAAQRARQHRECDLAFAARATTGWRLWVCRRGRRAGAGACRRSSASGWRSSRNRRRRRSRRPT